MGDEAASLLHRHILLVESLTDQRLSRSDCAVLAIILEHVNSEGLAWPGVTRLQTAARCHRTTVLRGIQALEQTGYIKVERALGRSNRYRVVFTKTSSRTATGSEPETSSEPATGGYPATSSNDATTPVAFSLRNQSQPCDPNLLKELSLENSGEKARKKASRPSRKLTFDEWLTSIPEGEYAIPGSHAIYHYAERAGIPEEFLDLAWEAFQRKYRGTPKRYTDWPRVMQNAIEGDWLRLWRVDVETGTYYLTTAGQQLRRLLDAPEHAKAA